MVVKILDSILHGDLKPWKIDASNQKRFTELVKTAGPVLPKTNAELQKQLIALFADYPKLQKILIEETPNNNAALQQHFFSIDIPKYNDPVTEFYHILITKEALRFFNHYLQQSEKWIDPVDIHFQVNSTLTNIRVLAKQTAEELKIRGFTSILESKSDYMHFALFTLKQILTALFFEVQERFATQLSQTTTEEFYYIHYLQEPYPITPVLIPRAAYFEFYFRSIQRAAEFPKTTALNLLKQIQQHKPENSLRLQAAFENLIFLHSQNIDTESQTVEQLTEPITINQYFESAKSLIATSLNNDNYGYERLEIIENKIADLDYVAPGTVNKNSISSILLNWLLQKKEVYKVNANAVFSKNINAADEAARLKNPLSKRDKVTIEQQKKYAKEHLAFMNGYNIKNEKIMPESDYNLLMEHIYYLIEKEKLPKILKVIHKTGFASNGIRYTFYKIHEYLYGTQSIKQIWIDFLHAIFQQFNGTAPSTTRAKFSQKPKSYENDLKQMKR